MSDMSLDEIEALFTSNNKVTFSTLLGDVTCERTDQGDFINNTKVEHFILIISDIHTQNNILSKPVVNGLFEVSKRSTKEEKDKVIWSLKTLGLSRGVINVLVDNKQLRFSVKRIIQTHLGYPSVHLSVTCNNKSISYIKFMRNTDTFLYK